MMRTDINYAELEWLLLGLGFKRARLAGSGVAYRHAATDALIVLAEHDPSTGAKPSDVAAVQRILEEYGIIGREGFASRFLKLRERAVSLSDLRAQLASYRQWRATQQALIDQLQAQG